MKKVLMLVLVSSLFGGSAMAALGENKQVNCKDILAKIKAQAKNGGSSSSQSEDGQRSQPASNSGRGAE